MAYTLRNNGRIKPPNGSRIVHRVLRMTLDGSGAASGLVSIPSPGRLIAMKYHAADGSSALTNGALVVKAETTAGVQIFTDADLSSVKTTPAPVGTTALDEGNAATAATDGFSGGFPVRSGVFVSVASGTEAEVLHVHMWFKLCEYVHVDLVAQSGADGTGAVTRTINFNHAGILSAIAIDYQNVPNTTDIVIKADSSTGPTLYTRSNSNTDLGPTLLGSPGMDEAAAATAATDGTECANAFSRKLYIDVAQTDIFTSGNEKIVMELWIDA